MPSIWIGTAFSMLINDIKIYNYLYPTTFWFINALLIFYFLFYLIYRYIHSCKKIIIFLFIFLHIAYYLYYGHHTEIVMDGHGFETWFYFFVFFLFGFYIRNKEIYYNSYSIPICIITIILFYIYKELAKVYPSLIFWQFIIQPLILFLFIIYALKSAKYISDLKMPNKLKLFLSKISNLTLEVYITQLTIIHLVERSCLIWYYKIIISLILIFITSYIFNKIASKVSSLIRNKIN